MLLRVKRIVYIFPFTIGVIVLRNLTILLLGIRLICAGFTRSIACPGTGSIAGLIALLATGLRGLLTTLAGVVTLISAILCCLCGLLRLTSLPLLTLPRLIRVGGLTVRAIRLTVLGLSVLWLLSVVGLTGLRISLTWLTILG